jgi:dipeptidyl aminopeptidase/acylaminoacyl peptidase
VTSFDELSEYVAIPRVTALRLSPDGSWLAAAVQTAAGEPQEYVTSIWRIPVAGDGIAARLTRSAEGEGGPDFLPDGSVLFISKRPGPKGQGRGTGTGPGP